jgi:hypothetical protein
MLSDSCGVLEVYYQSCLTKTNGVEASVTVRDASTPLKVKQLKLAEHLDSLNVAQHDKWRKMFIALKYAYIFSMSAFPNSLHLSSVAPSMRRWKS